jgi:predicted transcriptional regulator
METRELLFELAHPIRYGIVQEIAHGPKRLTKLAVLVDASTPEVSRHLERLGEVGITEKNAEGSYSLAPIGKIIVNCLPAFEFVARESEYLQSHDLSRLPSPFLSRLGDLGAGEIRHGELSNIELVLGILRRARRRLRVLTLESFHTSSPDGGTSLSGIGLNMDYRLVVDRRYRFRHTQHPGGPPSPELKEVARVVTNIPAASVATESEAAIAFPARNGKLDYSVGLYSTHGPFVAWCSELTDYLWERGERIGVSPQRPPRLSRHLPQNSH